MSEKFTVYKEHPKTCASDDYWGQVKRTVDGKPVTQEQIDMIVGAVTSGIGLSKNDILLDICCGNGALTTLLFQECSGGLGVDFSEVLITVANEKFSKGPDEAFTLQDAVEFCRQPVNSAQFTKAVCYGSFSFIENYRAEEMLSLLRKNFPNLRKLFIGNYPDKGLIDLFIEGREFDMSSVNDPDSAIGIWRTKAEFSELATKCGWKAEYFQMPEAYYASHYRYDVVLSCED